MLAELLCPIGYSAAVKIIGGKLYGNLIAGQYFYIVHSHFAGYGGQRFMAIRKFHPKHRIGKSFENLSLEFY